MGVRFFGQYLLEHRVITTEQLEEVLEYQESHNYRLGEFAHKIGYLSLNAAEKINELQRTRDLRFGEAAIELQLLSKDQVEELLKLQKVTHVFLGEAIIRKGFANKETIEALLKDFHTEQIKYHISELKLPEQVKEPQIPLMIFDTTRKLLLRMWGVLTKLMPSELSKEVITAPDMLVQIPFAGKYKADYYLGMTYDVTKRGAKTLLGESDLAPDELLDLVGELANVVCGNILTDFHNHGKETDILPPKYHGNRVILKGRSAVICNLMTPYGKTIVAMTF